MGGSEMIRPEALVEVSITSRGGVGRIAEGESGRSLMEVIRANGFDELLALCGGCQSCGTCHVYVQPDFPSATNLPPVSEEEDALLDNSDHRRSESRLSCQILLHDGLGGLRVKIAPED